MRKREGSHTGNERKMFWDASPKYQHDWINNIYGDTSSDTIFIYGNRFPY